MICEITFTYKMKWARFLPSATRGIKWMCECCIKGVGLPGPRTKVVTGKSVMTHCLAVCPAEVLLVSKSLTCPGCTFSRCEISTKYAYGKFSFRKWEPIINRHLTSASNCSNNCQEPGLLLSHRFQQQQRCRRTDWRGPEEKKWITLLIGHNSEATASNWSGPFAKFSIIA